MVSACLSSLEEGQCQQVAPNVADTAVPDNDHDDEGSPAVLIVQFF